MSIFTFKFYSEDMACWVPEKRLLAHGSNGVDLVLAYHPELGAIHIEYHLQLASINLPNQSEATSNNTT